MGKNGVASLAVLAREWLELYGSQLDWSDDHVKKGRAAVDDWLRVTSCAHVAALSRGTTRTYIHALLTAGRSRKTVANRLSLLRRFGEWLIEHGLQTVNPWSIPLAKTRSGPGATPLTTDEVRRLVATTEATDDGSSDRRRTGRARAAYYLFLFLTGLRRRESRRQRWDDVDFARRRMRVTASKSRRLEYVPLSAETTLLLRRLLDTADGPLVFPRPPIESTLRRDMQRAGVAIARGNWHRFRKAAVTALGVAGVPLRVQARFARHMDLRTTAESYDIVGDGELREALGALDAIFYSSKGNGLDEEGKARHNAHAVEAREHIERTSIDGRRPPHHAGNGRLDSEKWVEGAARRSVACAVAPRGSRRNGTKGSNPLGVIQAIRRRAAHRARPA